MKPNFEKGQGLIPAIIQHANTGKVLMLGYMNEAAYEQSKSEGKVTFFSRSKQRLWTKGESSGNELHIRSMKLDCDQDTILVQAIPNGPVCHTGSETCFDDADAKGFLFHLQDIIHQTKDNPREGSYTRQLFSKGINKIAQKVGEEAVELVIEAKDDNRDLFLGEAADLMYHFLVLLAEKDLKLEDVEAVLRGRNTSLVKA